MILLLLLLLPQINCWNSMYNQGFVVQVLKNEF